MNDKTNKEKLRILQERLANIQQKKEIHQEEKIQKNKPVAPVFEEELVNRPNIDPIEKTPKQPRKKSGCFKYFIISFILFFIILLVGGGGFIAYNAYYGDGDWKSLFISNKPIEKEIEIEKNIIYPKEDYFSGNYIIVLNNYDINEKEKADQEVNKLTEKGHNCKFVLLSEFSEEEGIQTYIEKRITEKDSLGFMTHEQATQYLNSSIFISEEGEVIELQ